MKVVRNYEDNWGFGCILAADGCVILFYKWALWLWGKPQ